LISRSKHRAIHAGEGLEVRCSVKHGKIGGDNKLASARAMPAAIMEFAWAVVTVIVLLCLPGVGRQGLFALASFTRLDDEFSHQC